MRLKILIYLLMIIASSSLFAQDKITLFDVEKARQFLSLDKNQMEKIMPKIIRIKVIREEDQKIITNIQKRFQEGDEPGLFEKIKIKMARGKRQSEIRELVDEIEDLMTDKQKEKFSTMEKPYLPDLTKQDISGEK